MYGMMLFVAFVTSLALQMTQTADASSFMAPELVYDVLRHDIDAVEHQIQGLQGLAQNSTTQITDSKRQSLVVEEKIGVDMKAILNRIDSTYTKLERKINDIKRFQKKKFRKQQKHLRTLDLRARELENAISRNAKQTTASPRDSRTKRDTGGKRRYRGGR